jgi:hypothetical protein
LGDLLKVAIMQPYVLPYIGYFQLIQAADLFIVYDNIKYTKKGWINRNRFLQNGRDIVFSVPLKKDSDVLDVNEREVARDFNKSKLLNQIRESYRRAPYFEQTFPIFENILLNSESNLFKFIHNSILKVCAYLGIVTPMKVASTLSVDHALHNQERVLAFCEWAGAQTYINPIGGVDLYSAEAFRSRGIELRFLKSKSFEYKQFDKPFVPWLSILDVMMFNSKDRMTDYLSNGYELITSSEDH